MQGIFIQFLACLASSQVAPELAMDA